MNLTDVVQLLSDTYNNCQQLWMSVGIQDEDMEQRRISFFQEIMNQCQEFYQQQKSYLDYVNNEINTFINKAQLLNTQLELNIEIPQNEQNNKFLTLQKVQRILKTLTEEFQHRQTQANQLMKDIQVKSEAGGLDVTIQLNSIFQIPICEINQKIEKQSVTLNQLQHLNQLNSEIDVQIAPMLETAQQLRSQLMKKLTVLGRAGLEIYFSNLFGKRSSGERLQQSFQISEQQLQIINLTMNNQLQPTQNQFIQQFVQALDAEITERQEEIGKISAQLQEMQQAQCEIHSVLDDSEQLEVPQIDLRPDCFTDQYYLQIHNEYQQALRFHEQNGGVIVGLLIRKKYEMLQTVNPKFKAIQQISVAFIKENSQIFQFEDVSAKIIALVGEIQQLQVFLKNIQPIQQVIEQYQQQKADNEELAEICRDKNRFTSKNREALQKRKREEQLRKELAANYPKICAALVQKMRMTTEQMNVAELNLNDFDIFWSKVAGPPHRISEKDLFGVDYEDEIKVMLSKQDSKFVERYTQFFEYYKRESAELEKSVVTSPALQLVVKTPSIQKLNQKLKTPNRLMQTCKTPTRNVVRTPLMRSLVESATEKSRIPNPFSIKKKGK